MMEFTVDIIILRDTVNLVPRAFCHIGKEMSPSQYNKRPWGRGCFCVDLFNEFYSLHCNFNNEQPYIMDLLIIHYYHYYLIFACNAVQ